MRLFAFSLVLLSNLLVNAITYDDTVKMVKSLFDYHIEQKAFNQSLLHKYSKNFIHLFDPDKNYLLEEELEGLRLNDPIKVQKILEQFEKGKLDVWQKEFYAFKHSITRARSIRDEIYRSFLLELQFERSGIAQSPLLYPDDLSELKNRWQKKIYRFVLNEFKQTNLDINNLEYRKKALDLFEKKMQRLEDRFFKGDRLSNFYEHLLKSFAKSLDAHTAFFSTQEGLDLKKSLEKQFEGVGVTLKESILGVVVSDLVLGGPAIEAGVQKGDRLVRIGHQEIQEMDFEDVLKALEGPKNSEVKLSFLSGKTDKTYDVNLKRQTIVLTEGRIQTHSIPYGNSQIGVIKLSSFYDNKMGSSSESDVKAALYALKNKQNLSGIILDIRQNGGGFLNQAVKVSGLFIKAGVVAVSRYAHGRSSYLRDLDPSCFYNGPLIVLTSKASASAAEVVAGALQDYGRALIVGDPTTYGKGSIQYQNVTDPEAKNYFKVTVGRYFTVSGKTTQIDGVKADILVPSMYYPYNIGERYLENALASDRIAPLFIDPLSDIEEGRRSWFQKNYLPFLQTKEFFWADLLPTLKSNSQYRIQNSQAYQRFLKEPLELNRLCEEDLPLKEAITIMKDALILKDF
jgi:carboxyl-terminal processing protease